MRILITGTAGLIGRWVYRRLAQEGHEPIGLDLLASPEDFRQVKCDLLRLGELKNAIERVAPDAIVHLAARTDLRERRSLDGYAANIQGIHNLLDAIEDSSSCCRLVCASSQLVCRVGHVPDRWDEYCPNTLYGESKVLTEKIIRERDGGGVCWTLVRPTTVWGPHMSEHYLSLLRYIEHRRYFHVGNRMLFKSYSYAGNIAYQIFKILQAPEVSIKSKTLYLADYAPLSIRNYCDQLQKELKAPSIPVMPEPVAHVFAKCGDVVNAVGVKFPFNSFRLKNILTEYQFDLTETAEICGPLPFGFEEGVTETVRWYKQRMSRS